MSATLRDRLGSLLMLVFIAVLWGQRDYTTPFGGMFPDGIMVIMTGFIVLALLLSFTSHRVMKENEDDIKEPQSSSGERRLEMLVVIVVLLFWVLLFRYLGFAVSGVTGFAFIAWFISGERRRWQTVLKALVVGLALTYLSIFIFGHLLLVPLPEGEIFG